MRACIECSFFVGWMWCLAHCVMSFFLFQLGVSLKKVISKGQGNEYLPEYAW